MMPIYKFKCAEGHETIKDWPDDDSKHSYSAVEKIPCLEKIMSFDSEFFVEVKTCSRPAYKVRERVNADL
jgi:hypothetical protein